MGDAYDYVRNQPRQSEQVEARRIAEFILFPAAEKPFPRDQGNWRQTLARAYLALQAELDQAHSLLSEANVSLAKAEAELDQALNEVQTVSAERDEFRTMWDKAERSAEQAREREEALRDLLILIQPWLGRLPRDLRVKHRAALAAEPESIIEVPPGRFEADEVLEELQPESTQDLSHLRVEGSATSPQEKP